jgi:deoxyribodipyrimidine photo-lyase
MNQTRPDGCTRTDRQAVLAAGYEVMTSVFWFRRDLRLHDNPALHDAAERGPVAALFVMDELLIHGRWPSANRVAFMLDSLRRLDESLGQRGSRLHVRMGRPEHVVPAFAAEANAGHVFAARDYSPYARRRDAAVAAALTTVEIEFHTRRGVLVHEPEEVSTADGSPFSVFTPFFRRWSALPRRAMLAVPDVLHGPSLATEDLPTVAHLGLAAPAAGILAGGEAAARKRLDSFIGGGMSSYAERRDLLGREGTSRLSQDLRWGLLSPLEVVERASGSPKFVSEVVWREFYHHILWHHPRVVREPFQAQFRNLDWEDEPAVLDAWKRGATGYPVVDAAMRELLATGYMHNRARMIAASFLTKDLLIDWREGERHFMEHLVDGDLANNNGGWQWAASTGTDAQPYFRIFNPHTQAAKFDPEGHYVRRWLPELARVPSQYLHRPHEMPAEIQRSSRCVVGVDYPAPIVDHAIARERALARYAAARRSAATRSE